MRFLADLGGTLLKKWRLGLSTLDGEALSGSRIHSLPDASGVLATEEWVAEQLAGVGDGVTRANFIEYMLNVSPLQLFEDFRFYEGVGWARQILTQVGAGFAGTAIVTGAGASVAPNLSRQLLVSTGTTATGNARYLYAPTSGRDWIDQPLIPAQATTDFSLMFTARVRVTALGTEANDYLFALAFGGFSHLGDVATMGIRLEYRHSENAGNWVIKYPKSDGSVGQVNTSVPVVTGFNLDVSKISVQCTRSGGLTSEVKVTFGTVDPVTYTITDSSFHTSATQIAGSFVAYIAKLAGATSVTGSVETPIIGATR